jgi:hypothetical protein
VIAPAHTENVTPAAIHDSRGNFVRPASIAGNEGESTSRFQVETDPAVSGSLVVQHPVENDAQRPGPEGDDAGKGAGMSRTGSGITLDSHTAKPALHVGAGETERILELMRKSFDDRTFQGRVKGEEPCSVEESHAEHERGPVLSKERVMEEIPFEAKHMTLGTESQGYKRAVTVAEHIGHRICRCKNDASPLRGDVDPSE